MRDLAFLLFFLIIIYLSLKRPFIGVAMWLWVAMHYPKGWVYGFASGIRYNLIIVLLTIFSYIAWKYKPKVVIDKLTVLILVFLFWTLITSVFTIADLDIVWAEWIEFLKIVLLYLFAIAILRNQLHINVVVWALALSVGFYGGLEGLKYLSSGGGHQINGVGPYVLGDRNELALAFNMVLPFMVYLVRVTDNTLVKWALRGAIILNIIAIFGTYSRGGLVGLLVVGGYFWLQSKRKIIYGLLFVIIGSVSITYMPDNWKNRMDTIETAQDDLSFLGRVLAWKHAVLLANDSVTGGGFKAGQTSYIWNSNMPALHFNEIIDTTHLAHIGYKAAHSIYFQVLGDHGYIGLLLFLSIIMTAYFKSSHVIKKAKKTGQSETIVFLCQMLRVSLVAYCAGGAAVSLAYFDAFYMILAIVYVVDSRIIHSESRVKNRLNMKSNQGEY